MRNHIDLGGRSLHVETQGTPPPDFLCLHGLADTAAIWRKVAPELARRGRVIAVDQRAHGESGAAVEELGIEDLAADAVTLLDRLEIDRAILVGHSMGGIVAMSVALAAPDRVAALILLGTTSQVSERAAAWYGRIAEAGEQGGLEGLRGAIFGKDSAREIRGDARGMASLTRSLARLHEKPLTPELARISCPALLLVGDKDPMGPAASEIIARNLPGARLEVIPGGHWLHLEAPGVVVDAIERFLGTL